MIINNSRMKKYKEIALLSFSTFLSTLVCAQNPIITNQYTADPSARVFGDKVYLFPSHDITASQGKGRVGWFCMEDYHVFSSSNLREWSDQGIIITQNKIPWVKADSYNMWAPDCIEKNGKYYFYFPATPGDSSYGRGFTIGVAVADNPEGPYTPLPDPIKGVRGIDPNVFIDRDGQAYLYRAGGNIYGAKLKENMVELASEPVILKELPTKGLKEGPYLFERKGIYYLTYPHVETKIERLEYTMSNNPLGPFKNRGVLMDESTSGCWTNHQSVIQFINQWYLFYHNNDLSPQFDKNRSVRIDSLFFNEDGTIQKVLPTLRGVGQTNAKQKIQIDRYTQRSNDGASIDFIDSLNKFNGWKTIFSQAGAWVQYNSVDFGKPTLKTITVRALSQTGGILQIHANDINGLLIAEIKIPKSSNWKITKFPVLNIQSGIHNLFVVLKDNKKIEVDWIGFE